MTKKTKIISLTVILLAVAAVAAALCLSGKKDGASLTYLTSAASYADISNYVTATGTIEPVTEVEVGTQVSGIIDNIYVDYNSHVKEGQLIAEMDKVTLQSELESAMAQYEGSQAEFEYQKKNYERTKTLFEKSMVSESEYDQALYNYRMSESAYKSSSAALDKAKRNLSYATITSPIDGVVIDRAVEEGQTVAAGFETPTLFTIAADLTKMQVVADVDEADIGGVELGQRVSFTVDAYPDDVFEGYVMQIRLGSTSSSSSSATSTSESVVTYEVVISADNPDLKLKPRLTANITIYTMDKQNVLSVPAKALRFTADAFTNGDNVVRDCNADAKVWVRKGDTVTAVPVTAGLSNGVLTEITGGLEPGMEVITDINMNVSRSKMPSSERSPFMPGPPGEKKNEK